MVAGRRNQDFISFNHFRKPNIRLCIAVDIRERRVERLCLYLTMARQVDRSRVATNPSTVDAERGNRFLQADLYPQPRFWIVSVFPTIGARADVAVTAVK
jgi:hypothetical protein